MITLYHKDETPFYLYSTGEVMSVRKYEQKWSLMDEDIVTLEVESSKEIPFAIGDYLMVYNRRYTLNRLPEVEKTSTRNYKYSARFEGIQYHLSRVIYTNVDDTAVEQLEGNVNFFVGEFSYTGKAYDFIQVIVYNMNRLTEYDGITWSIGDSYLLTSVKTLDFNGESCLSVLHKICSEYSLEFSITQTSTTAEINFYPIGDGGSLTGLELKYGYRNGLTKISRKNVDTSNVITALFVLGSTKNLASDYRGYSPRLKLAGSELSLITNSTKINLYGYTEGFKVYEDIFPHRTGTVTSLGSTYTDFFDSTMSFDLNDQVGGNTLYIIPGVVPKIHFNTGQLAGYEFILSNYDHSTKNFIIERYIDERGQNFPDIVNSVFHFGVGDEYVITDIRLPQSYIDQAEADLNTAGVAEYNLISQPQIKYDVSLDRQYIKRAFSGVESDYFTPGDKIGLEDTQLWVDKNFRITSITRDLIQPDVFEITLDDVPRKNKKYINTGRDVTALTRADLYSFAHRTEINQVINNYQTTVIEGVGDFRVEIGIELIEGEQFVEFSSELPGSYKLIPFVYTADGVEDYYDSITKQSTGFTITIRSGVSLFLDYIAIKTK